MSTESIHSTSIVEERYKKAIAGILLLASNRNLKKVTLSKPSDKSVIRAVITVKKISGKDALQIETFTSDNKAYHKNLFLDDGGTEASLTEIALGFSQINMISASGDAELRASKNGKVTIKGLDRILSASSEQKAPTDETENDRKKTRILDGSEPFLKLLDVSDQSGRVHDKKQAKFRQINRFLEHIRDIYKTLPSGGELFILDLCCGKSYLSFAVYHYLANVLGRKVDMRGIDLKPDVIEYCSDVAKKLGFDGLTFSCGDIKEYEVPKSPDLVVSLHACDIATDIVIDKAIDSGATVILSTPCCHHELNHKMDCPTLDFIADHSMLRQKLCDAATDALRLMRMEMNGYTVNALELIDPENTPKNILLRGIKKKGFDKSSAKAKELCEKYRETYKFLYGRNA